MASWTSKGAMQGLWVAVVRGDSDQVEELLSRATVAIDSLNPTSRQSLLHLAAMQGHEEIVSSLIRRGAALNVIDELMGETALHKATRGGFVRIVAMLIHIGANVHVKSKRGLTPHDLAVRSGNGAIVKLLGSDYHSERMRDRGLRLGAHELHLVELEEEARELVSNNHNLESEDIQGEMEFIKEQRRLEKQHHMTLSELENEKKRTEKLHESTREHQAMIRTRDAEISQLQLTVVELRSSLETREESYQDVLQKLENVKQVSKEKEKTVRNARELERRLEDVQIKLAEEKRQRSREREKALEKQSSLQTQVSLLGVLKKQQQGKSLIVKKRWGGAPRKRESRSLLTHNMNVKYAKVSNMQRRVAQLQAAHEARQNELEKQIQQEVEAHAITKRRLE